MYVKESKVEIIWHLPKPVNQTSHLDGHLKIIDKPIKFVKKEQVSCFK